MAIATKLMQAASNLKQTRYVGTDGASVCLTEVTASCEVKTVITACEDGDDKALRFAATAGICVPVKAKTKVVKHIASIQGGGLGNFYIDDKNLLTFAGYCAVAGDAVTTELLEKILQTSTSAWQFNYRPLVRLAYTKTSASALTPPETKKPFKPATRVPKPSQPQIEIPVKRPRGRPRKDAAATPAYI